MEMKADEEHVSVGIVFSPKILHASEKNPKFAGRVGRLAFRIP